MTALWDLASSNPNKYDGMFRQGAEPKLEEFRGRDFNGLILDIKDLEVGKDVYFLYAAGLGKTVGFAGRLYSQQLTFRKHFYPSDQNKRGINDYESGINYWPVKGEWSMPMMAYLDRPTEEDAGKRCLKIDYNISVNDPIAQRLLLDEVRQLPGSSLYIGKMYCRPKTVLGSVLGGLIRPQLFLWFALDRV